jgi:hypothetical protein
MPGFMPGIHGFLLPEMWMASLLSCPRLSRASTSSQPCNVEDVDGRDEPGHDVARLVLDLSFVMPARSLCHARPCAGHPRLHGIFNKQGVDGRNKSGHDICARQALSQFCIARPPSSIFSFLSKCSSHPPKPSCTALPNHLAAPFQLAAKGNVGGRARAASLNRIALEQQRLKPREQESGDDKAEYRNRPDRSGVNAVRRTICLR